MMTYTKQCMLVVLLIALMGVSISCDSQAEEETSSEKAIDVVMRDYAFAVIDSIPSGWNTFKMINKGEETHEFVLHRLPDGKSYGEMMTQIIQPMDSLEQLLLAGKMDSAQHEKALPRNLPKWVSQLETIGGGGLITPGETAHTTLHLDPGQYVMSCFIPSANGRAHVHQGMVRSITVPKTNSGNQPPKADIEITSSGNEITIDGTLGFGKQTILFTVEEPPPEVSRPYTTVYLAHITDPMMRIEDLRDISANPPPTDLLGGALAVPVGDTSYVTVELTLPGRYVWVLPDGPNGEKKTKFKKSLL